ncbi:Derlin-2 [Candida viswanathii]|uniref:Derlin n=1 Tax=Candida viswanathii TaxID=5486 RepID=A0A367YJD7_9ASCO|nr:Derlin-2 [Candida viswanathii]
MDQLWTNLPPVTKAWSVSIAATAALISTNRVKLINLIFVPDRAFGTQPWRLLTSFCCSEGLLMELLFELFLISGSCGRVEEIFSTKPALIPERLTDDFDQRQWDILHRYVEKNRVIDFFYYIVQIAVSIVVSASILHYELGLTIATLGAVLCRVLIYIDAQNNPHELINFMGFFTLRKSFYPWIEAMLTVFLNGGIAEDLAKLRDGNYGVLRNVLVWFYLMSIALGHFWWATRDLLLSTVHYDGHDRRREVKRDALKRYGVMKVDVVRESLAWLLLPPWYWIILPEIKTMRL